MSADAGTGEKQQKESVEMSDEKMIILIRPPQIF